MKPIIKNYIHASYPKGSVTQWFGENPDLYAFLDLGGHNGIDIVAPYGTPIMAPCDMVVVEIKDDAGGYGRHVRSVGGGYEIVFGHLSKIYDKVKLGCEIKEGEVFCNMGNSGFVVSGPTPFWSFNPHGGTHCHFGCRKFTEYLGTGGYNIKYSTGLRGTIENYGNGFKGSVDPMFLFSTAVIKEEDQKKQLMLTIIGLANQVVLLLKSIIKKKNEI